MCVDGTLEKSHSVTQTGHFVYPSPTDHKQIGGSRLKQLQSVADSNYFGDLVEGVEVYERLVSLMATARIEFASHAAKLQELSKLCIAANADLNSADDQISTSF